MKLARVKISVVLIAAVVGGVIIAALWMMARKPVPPQRPAKRDVPIVLAPRRQLVANYHRMIDVREQLSEIP